MVKNGMTIGLKNNPASPLPSPPLVSMMMLRIKTNDLPPDLGRLREMIFCDCS